MENVLTGIYIDLDNNDFWERFDNDESYDRKIPIIVRHGQVQKEFSRAEFIEKFLQA